MILLNKMKTIHKYIKETIDTLIPIGINSSYFPIRLFKTNKNGIIKILSTASDIEMPFLPNFKIGKIKNHVKTHEAIGYNDQVNDFDIARSQIAQVIMLRNSKADIANLQID